MIYKDIVNEQIKIKEHLDEFSVIIGDFKKILLDYNKNIDIVWRNTSETGNTNSNSLQQVAISKKSFNATFTSFNFDFMGYMSKLYNLKNTSENNETSLNFNKFVEVFNDFLVTLQSYLHNKKPSHIIPNLVLNLSSVVSSYESIMNEIEIISKYDSLLENQNYSNEEILELQFCNGVRSHKEILYLLTVIPDLYKRGLDLFRLNEEEFPLEIIKIESGSFFSKLAGHPMIIGLISSALTFSAHEIYNRYSPTTKVKREKEVLEVISEKLNIIEKMEGLGMDTTDMKEDVKAYTAKLYKDTKRISKLSTKMKVNNEVFQIEKSSELLFLKGQKEFIQTLSLPNLDVSVEGTEEYTSI